MSEESEDSVLDPWEMPIRPGDMVLQSEFGGVVLSKDIAANGEAQAETIDAELGTDAASQVAALLLASYLHNFVYGPRVQAEARAGGDQPSRSTLTAVRRYTCRFEAFTGPVSFHQFRNAGCHCSRARCSVRSPAKSTLLGMRCE